MSAHDWKRQPVPVVTLSGADVPVACTCADFQAAGTCRHLAEASAERRQLAAIADDDALDPSVPEVRAKIVAAFEALSEAQRFEWVRRIVLLRRGLWPMPYKN